MIVLGVTTLLSYFYFHKPFWSPCFPIGATFEADPLIVQNMNSKNLLDETTKINVCVCVCVCARMCVFLTVFQTSRQI